MKALAFLVLSFFAAAASAQGWRVSSDQVTDAIGRLDGLYELPGGGLLYTDWATGSLSTWSDKDGVKKLAEGFKGPADFGVIPGKKEMTVVVPDLVQSQIRFIHLRQQ